MDKLKMQTPNLVEDNIDKIAEIFPSCITEDRDENGNVRRAVDFDLLRQELSDHVVEGPCERYTLNWPGKSKAILAANAPIAKTLRPSIEESVDFETTKNLFIEGDNLDVLKLLHETYLNKIKMIYIDPPYNTGNDFIYEDDFAEDTESFLKRSNQKDGEGNRLVANTDTNGRFHSDWLSMMYPRLKLARNLLREDGVIFISIDDNEVANLRYLCDEVFGEKNCIAQLVWEKTRKNDAKLFSIGHEYMLIYARDIQYLKDIGTVWREQKPGAKEILERYQQLKLKFNDNNPAIEEGLRTWYRELPNKHPSKKLSRYKHVDQYGPWRDRDISWPGGGGPRYDVIHPLTGKACTVPEPGWRFSTPESMKKQIDLGLVAFREDHTKPPFRKAHLLPIPEECSDLVDSLEEENEIVGTQVMPTVIYKQAQVSIKYLRKLMGKKVFDNPKDHLVLKRLISYVTSRNDLIMDFFCGSASTAEGVLDSNKEDGGSRKFIMVQLPEPCDEKSEAFKAGYKIIAEIGKERIRRAGAKIKAELAKKQAEEGRQRTLFDDNASASSVSSVVKNLDIGFRVFKVDSSNMRDVYYSPDEIKQGQLEAYTNNIKGDRSPEDLLFQVFLDWGLELTLPVVKETIEGKTVLFVDGNVLAACFDPEITEELVKIIARRKPLRAVFRDDAYGSDSVKINVEQIFKLLSPTTDVKSL